MNSKVYFFLLACCLGMVVITYLYLSINLPPNINQTRFAAKKIKDSDLDEKLNQLESISSSNKEMVQKIKETWEKIDFTHSPNKDEDLLHPRIKKPPIKKPISFKPAKSLNISLSLTQGECGFSASVPSAVDIQMKKVYDELPFDNPDGGVWKQGWDVQSDPSRWSAQNKLKVFVVPHSHNDPGWIKTFERYFKDQTNHILDNMVLKLEAYPKMKFIWAEISYFALWWERQPEDVRNRVKGFVDKGQLEMVTGGWVMPDEANSHYYSMIDQLLTGHEWLRINLNVKPKNGWSIDPFGMSPTMAYILKRAGFENMLIQRTHYSVKKHLSRLQSLEFRWRQLWDGQDSTDMFCHMMPFYSYDVPHTCGPDPKICCQFDFKRLSGGKFYCPWKIPPKKIDDTNVEAKAKLLLDQYRKKAQLFKTNVVLAPLGDDFRYDEQSEWDQQFLNYQKLFDYMNSAQDLHVEAQFGTLADYFDAVRKEVGASNSLGGGDVERAFPSLSGDFFSYSDRDDHYWTGYFVSRPFYKRMDRVVQSYLRGAEILFSFAMDVGLSVVGQQGSNPEVSDLWSKLELARRFHGLFQHHDGVTGTSKDHVMIDYGNKMLKAIQNSQFVIEKAAAVLLNIKNTEAGQDGQLYVAEKFASHQSIGDVAPLDFDDADSHLVYLYNSEAQKRVQIATISVNTPYVKVFDGNNNAVFCQVDPSFDGDSQFVEGEFRVHFTVSLDALSITPFRVVKVTPSQMDKWTSHSVVVYNYLVSLSLPNVFKTVSQEDEMGYHLKAGHLSASFSHKGLLERIESNGVNTDVRLTFIKYKGGKSGAYLFLPPGESTDVPMERNKILVTKGSLISSLTLFHPIIRHEVVLKNSPGSDGQGLHFRNFFDIRQESNSHLNYYQGSEYGMRLNTNINSGDVFYTDLNGFQVIKRIRYNKLPLQAQFYPMPTQAFIEDDHNRLSLLGGQPLGCSSLASGQIEVLFDRRLMQDDERGLGQGVTDNLLTRHSFSLLLEPRSNPSRNDNIPYGLPSLTSLSALSHLLHPTLVLHRRGAAQAGPPIWSRWSSGGELPCDVELVNLRTRLADIRDYAGENIDTASSSAALTLHRRGFSCDLPAVGLACSLKTGQASLAELFPRSFRNDPLFKMSLSHWTKIGQIQKSNPLSLEPMEIYAFDLPFSQ